MPFLWEIWSSGKLTAICPRDQAESPLRARSSRRSTWAQLEKLCYPAKWPGCLVHSTALDAAGDLKDTPAGRKKYGEHLVWLAEDDRGRKDLGSEPLSKGWAGGGRAPFELPWPRATRTRCSEPAESGNYAKRRRSPGATLCKKRSGGCAAQNKDFSQEKKSAPWKIAVAAWLKQNSSVKNPWLAMGTPTESVVISPNSSSETGGSSKGFYRTADIRVLTLFASSGQGVTYDSRSYHRSGLPAYRWRQPAGRRCSRVVLITRIRFPFR